ncbi:hypothetical protein B0T26DRAFT_602787, partial [Lasiosphaeria miniovina]
RPSQAQQQQQALPPTTRQNEYFVPRDGIDREVITSDICRYLGHDALVRPGTYESPDGRVTQGYFITAYRNLTSAMIQDLKQDSARWEQERRAASRSSGGGAGGTMHSSQPNGAYLRSSNSPVGAREQARGGPSDYSTWKNRQQRDQETFTDYGAMDIDYPSVPNPAKNVGYNAVPYTGVPAPAYPPAAYPPQAHPAAPQFASQPYGYPGNLPAGYSSQPQTATDRYPGMAPPPAMAPAFAQDTAYIRGSDFRTGYGAPPPNVMPMPLTSGAPSRTFPAPTGGAPGYGGDTDIYGYSTAAGNTANQAFPQDPQYGRVPRPPQGYGAVPEPQFDDQNSGLPPAPVAPNAAPAPMPNNGQPAARRDRDSEPRERERDHHRSRRTEPDREDRHAAERERRRHR